MKKIFLLGAIMALTCCNTPPYTTKELLAAEKESQSKSVPLSGIRPRVEEQTKSFIEVFSRYDRKELAETIPLLYAEEAFLNDRIHSVVGMENIAAYFDATFEKMHRSEFIIQETTYGEKEVLLKWLMRIQLKPEKEFMEFLGMSALRFDQEGKIVYHQDYWDFSELLSHIGGVRWLINYSKS